MVALSALSTDQQQAATAPPGPVLVLAGPGTGKTTTLTARFVHLVRDQGVAPERIMAVTFTRRAAEALRQRIGDALGVAPGALPWVGTFHALTRRMLTDLVPRDGLEPGFQVWTDAARRRIFAEKRWWWDEDDDILDIIGAAKEQMQDADAFAADVERRRKQGELGTTDALVKAVPFFRLHEQALHAHNAVDFTDLVNRTVRALETDDGARAAWAGCFDHVLIDEYQDVNPGQVRLVDALLHDHQNVWAVGDDDQCLYAFRGADPGYILEFERRHPGAAIHVLHDNHRSPPAIITAAQGVIQGTQNRRAKTQNARGDGRAVVRVSGFDDAATEARRIANAISHFRARGLEPGGMAVLYRAGLLSARLQTAMRAEGLPYVVRGSRDLWDLPEVRLFRGVLRLAVTPDSAEGAALLGRGRRAERLQREAHDLRKTAAEAVFQTLADKAASVVRHAVNPRDPAARKRDWEAGIEAARAAAGDVDSVDALEALVQDQARAVRDAPGDAVVLSTIHAAKGLEWPVVFVAGMERGLMPHPMSDSTDEERRVAYVAMTRAQRRLFVSYARNRLDEPAGPSPFLEDLAHAPAAEALEWPDKDRDVRPPRKPRADTKGEAGGRPGARWTQEEERALKARFEAGESLNTIAEALNRGRGGIQRRLVKLGLVAEGEIPGSEA